MYNLLIIIQELFPLSFVKMTQPIKKGKNQILTIYKEQKCFY